jgi:uncharacterized protein (DUF2164 family)
MSQLKNTTFHFTKDQQDELRAAIRAYFLDEMEIELSNLQTDFFIDFLNEHVGKKYYNLGVIEAIKAIKESTEDLVLLMRE